MLALVLLLQLSTQAANPEAALDWMSPERLGLCIGMARPDVETAVERAGLKAEPGKYSRQLVVHYAETKTVTMQFVDDRLQSIRFELVDFIPTVRGAYKEQVAAIEKQLGYEVAKQKGDRAVLMYNRENPNIMVVLSTVPDDAFGRQGLGFLAIRWFDPEADRISQ